MNIMPCYFYLAPHRSIARLVVLFFLCLISTTLVPVAAQWNYTPGGTWPPPSNRAFDILSTVVPMDALVHESPPRIDIRIFNTGDFKLYRKNPLSSNWGPAVATVNIPQGTSLPYVWSDTDVEVGILYDYGVGSAAGSTPNFSGNLLAGIKVDQTLPKGRFAIVVAEDVIELMPVEYVQYKADLVADGWTVHEIITPRAPDYLSNQAAAERLTGVTVLGGGTNYTNGQYVLLSNGAAEAIGQITAQTSGNKAITSMSVTYSGGPFQVGEMLTMTGHTTGSGANLQVASIDETGAPEHVSIKNQLLAIESNHPGELQNVVLLGKVAVARSGVGYSGPDGHGNRLAAGADAYYADLDGVWNDTSNNFNYYRTTMSDGLSSGRINVAGDLKFDPSYMSQLSAAPNRNLELGFGRVDFSNDIPSEQEALRQYLNKLHRYKTAAADFRPGRKALYRHGSFPGEEPFRMMLWNAPGIFGMENIDFVTAAEAQSLVEFPYEDGDSAWSRERGPYVFHFRSNSTPDLTYNSRSMFWTGLQSSWGYWYESSTTSAQNRMAALVAREGFTVNFTWSIWGVYYLYYRLGMGFDAGDILRRSMSERFITSNYGVMFMNQMGCPSVRLFMFPPPTDLSIVELGGHPSLSWSAAEAPPADEPQIMGYHVYRASEAVGPYIRITSEPIPGTSYVDTTVTEGLWNYQVKAVRLETTGGGTFYNSSLATAGAIDLSSPSTPVTVITETLPDAGWNNHYSAKLLTVGGAPVYSWTLTAGALPPGLTLAPNGIISGVPTASGAFVFTVEATDQLGQKAQRELVLNSGSNQIQTFYAEVNQYLSSANSNKWSVFDKSLRLSGPTYLYQPFFRFDLSALAANNAVVGARLILSVEYGSTGSTIALAKASLTEDTGDGWTESMSWASRPLDNSAFQPIAADGFAAALGTVEFDLLPFVEETLANDPAKKVSLRISTNKSSSFGNWVQVSSRFAVGDARPRLLIETTDAPVIVLNSPSVNPAAIYTDSALLLKATVTPIPERDGSVVTEWTQATGPGSVIFGDLASPNTTATFSAPGDYVLRLTANDGVLVSAKDLRVRVLAPPANTAPVVGPEDPALILRMPFDEVTGSTVTDVTSPANNGAFGSDVPMWTTEGRIGGALDFSDSDTAIVSIPHAPELDGMQQLTISLWVKLAAADNATHNILAKRLGNSTSLNAYTINSTNVEKISVQIHNQTSLVSTEVLEVGQWYHVAAVFDGSKPSQNLLLYLNGNPEQESTLSITSVPVQSTANLMIGDANQSITEGFDGMIDEVRIYNRALSLAEIQELFEAKPDNIGPQITVPSEISGDAGNPVAIAGNVIDDGLPGPINSSWSQLSGPATAVIDDAYALATTVTPPNAGSYLLRFIADDGEIATFADLELSATGGDSSLYQQWAADNGLPTDGTGLGAWDAAPANDGIANGIKFGLGLNPWTPGYGGRLSLGQVEESNMTYVSITYIHPEPAPFNIIYSPRSSDDLINWSEAHIVEVSSQSNAPLPGWRTTTVRDSIPIQGENNSRFLQLMITLDN